MPCRPHDVLDDAVAVDGLGESLAHLEVVEGLLGGVEAQIIGAEVTVAGVVLLVELSICSR